MLPLINNIKLQLMREKAERPLNQKRPSAMVIQTSNGMRNIKVSAVKLKWPILENWTN